MKTITIEEAHKLGQRAHSAGMRFAIGMGAIYMDPNDELHEDIVVGIKESGDDIYDPEVTLFSELTCNTEPNPVSAFSDTVPDLRDPGTKGHAVAQLRERTGDPTLVASYYAHTTVVGRPIDLQWRVETVGGPPYPTEEEAIVAAFEAIKETP